MWLIALLPFVIEYPRLLEGPGQLSTLPGMKIEEFIAQHQAALKARWGEVARRYQVSEHEFIERVYNASRHICGDGGTAKNRDFDAFLTHLHSSELCLAIACENGDEEAWRDFESLHRSSMQGAARALTRNDVEAEELTLSLMGDLYGIRVEENRRLSKLTHYSGRGSLGGWLRAVVYQTFVDRKRETSRFEQVDELDELDRLASKSSGNLLRPQVRPDDLEGLDDERLQLATEAAMVQAFAALETRMRLLLEYYYFDDLTLREIGGLMGVHEATISRWLQRAQHQVRRKTEEILQQKHGMKRGEVAECLQLAARSGIDVRRLVRDQKKGGGIERAGTASRSPVGRPGRA
jgi:RNA polymerase sigma-70 factor (ECF subfamily)